VFEYIYPLTITAQSIYSSPASPGDELTFVYKIKNPSDRAVSNIRLGARIRTNSPQGSWIDDPANDKVISVDPGEKDYSRKFRIPSDVSSGYYDAGWVIVNQNTDEYQVAEAWVDENVMTRILYIESSAQPDLIVEDIWVDPDPPIAGASNRIRYRIKNQGGGDAVETFRTNRYFDGALDGHADTSGLTAGSTKTYYKDMTWPSDSNPHTIKAITDVNGAISESNEGNNERSESFSAECSTPDAPTLTSPGTSSKPGEEIETLTPTFRWQAVSSADQYGLYISKDPYGSGNIVYENEAISGSSTSLPLPSGYLQDGVKYRWNMRAHNSAGWSSYGIEDGKTRLYFWVNIVLPNRVKGIDVSEYQGNINWPTVYDSGYRFAFARASLGDENPPTLIDDYFETNMENGHAAGILMGAYHFAYPNYGTEASSEARHFLNVAGEYLKEGYLRPVLDLEQGEELGKEALSNWVHEWMNTVKSETGIEPIIYVNSNYANNYLDSSVIQYDLWIAHWRCDTGTPPNTGIWNDWDFWQYYSPDYCGVNSVPGISGGVDLDIFNGDMDRLYTFVIDVCCGNMGVNPTSWSITTNCGESDGEIVTVSASGGTVKGVTVGKISGPTWLSVSQTDLGDIAAGSSKTFTITASPPSETSGDFPYTVRVSNTCGTPSTRDVTGTITVRCPELSYSPTSHDFGDKCEGETDSTTFEIWNSGTGTLTYSLSGSCSFVDVNPTSGSSTEEHDTITVDIDTTGLSEGPHTCDISISSNDGSGTFTVTVNVVPCEEPVLSYSPTSRDFGDMCEGETDSTTFEIWNSGTGTLTYSLSESGDWVEVNPTSGSSNGEHDTITVDIDTTGLSEGSHTCDITINSNDGSGTFTARMNVIDLLPIKGYLHAKAFNRL
jgi:GH25 family lysozyme M1 (1,4-beta-N-acetylmuramidase)